jgi:phenylalanyl-tRNA synthetase beta chain
MRVSYRWVLQLLGSDVPLQELLGRLTMAGLEVESVLDLGAESGRVLTARILDIQPHPNAESLVLCTVDAGGSEPKRIVCGAKNMKPGDWIPLAVEGAKLPNGITIKKSKIRGEASEGMMCSGRELGWSDDQDGLLILPQENGFYKVGEPFDALIDVKVTPNRPDCLSIFGIARDLAAATTRPKPEFPAHSLREDSEDASHFAHVELKSPEDCPRYTGRVIRDVTVGPSPLWLKRAVESAGLRSINNVVDVTNYVLVELGQPLHAFDLDKIASGKLIIRRATSGERIALLDGQELELSADELLISDSDKALALAGIMGCGNSEISESTTNVFLECAYFRPQTIRLSSKRLNKATDSSYRFERGTDWQNLDKIVDRAAMLIQLVAGGTIAKGRFDEQGKLPQLVEIPLSATRVTTLLGMPVSVEEIRTALCALGFNIKNESTESDMSVEVPAFRPDVSLEADLVEEVGRIVGYDRIPSALPKFQMRAAPVEPPMIISNRIRQVFVARGFHEAVSYSFTSVEFLEKCGYDAAGLVMLKIPLSGEYAAMRPSIVPSLLAAVLHNQNHGSPEAALFEIGKVFLPGNDGAVEERMQFAAIIAGSAKQASWRSPEKASDFFDAKAAAEDLLRILSISGYEVVRPEPVPGLLHPGKSATLRIGQSEFMTVGELHPKLKSALELKRNVMLVFGDCAALEPHIRDLPELKNIPEFPSVTRDLALIADEVVPAADIEAAIAKRAKALLARIQLFDVYQGERIAAGKKSLAYALEFSAQDRTLKDEEINQLQEKILADLRAKLGVELRA